jgi:hypothetical protein
VFYDRSSPESNKGLIEIKDQEFLSKLKKEYDENIERYKTDQPIICGTLVNKSHNQKQFDRKLKMIKAPLYALLQIC